MPDADQLKPRKSRATGGRRRDRAATERRLIDAVGGVLERDGVLALGINSIAKRANVDKVLIYRYFSDLDGLLGAYAAGTRLWPDLAEVAGDAPAVLRALAPVDRLALLLGNLAEALARHPQSLDIMVWRVFERNALTDALAAEQAALIGQMLDLALSGSTLAAEDVMPRLVMMVDALAMDLIRARQANSAPALGAARIQDLSGRLFDA